MKIRREICCHLVAILAFVACDKSIWPEEAINPYPIYLKYDTLRLTLFFDDGRRLGRFDIQRPLEHAEYFETRVEFDSQVIPLRGAFSMRFNDSYNEITKKLEEQEPPSYVITDTGTVIWADWVFEDRTRIDLFFLNDSLFLIDSDVKWAILPSEITIGTAIDSVVAIYGTPDVALQTKSWFMQPLRIFGIDIWLTSPHRIYESFDYFDQDLQLNFNGSNKLRDWVLRRPRDKQIMRISTAFDSLVIPKTGAFGIFFNTPADSIQQVLGHCQSFGYTKNKNRVLTFLSWHWSDSVYIRCEFSNDSLDEITSNVEWALLPKGIRIGDTKKHVIKIYGEPSSVSKFGTSFSSRRVYFE